MRARLVANWDLALELPIPGPLTSKQRENQYIYYVALQTKQNQRSRQCGDSSSVFHRAVRVDSRRGDRSTDQRQTPRERCRVSRLRPRKRRASVGRIAVVDRWRWAETTSSVGPQYPWPGRRGLAANDLVGWTAGLGCGKGRSGGRRNSPPSRGTTGRSVGERRCSSKDLESTVRQHDSGPSGICTHQ